VGSVNFPDYFQIGEMIEGSVVTYGNSEDRRHRLQTVLESEQRLESLGETAERNSRAFTLGRQWERFTRVLSELL